MNENEISLFAKNLMVNVRDKAIQSIDLALEGKWKSSDCQELYLAFIALPPASQAFVMKIIPIVTDFTLAHMLGMLEDYPEYDIKISKADGSTINLKEVSDLVSSNLSEWATLYSTQRQSFAGNEQ